MIVSEKVVLTCAVVGGAPLKKGHPHFPITPAEIAASALAAHRAGAAIVHLHVRDPETGAASRRVDLFKEVCDRIRDAGTDIIINLTCGHGARFFPDPDYEGRALPRSDVASVDERAEHLEVCRPEIASLDIGTSNQVSGPDEFVYLNTTRTLRGLAERFEALSIKPELEVFGVGDIMFGNTLFADGILSGNPLYQFVLGVNWCLPTDVETISYLKSYLTPNAQWGALGIGRYQFPVAAQTCIMGGNVRVGLEDNLYAKKGEFASNEGLVTRCRTLVEALGGQLATANEAREILGIR